MFRFVCVYAGSGRAFMFEDARVKTVSHFDENYLASLITQYLGANIDLEDVEFYELGEQNPLIFEKTITITYTIHQAV